MLDKVSSIQILSRIKYADATLLPSAPIVLDPVMVSTSGSLLLTEESIQDLITHLLPLCTLLTPNIPEARQLLLHARNGKGIAKQDLSSVEDLFQAAKELCELGPKATLVKGGHQVIKSSVLQQSLESLGVVLQETSSSRKKAEILGAEVYTSQWLESKVTVIRTDEEPYADILRRWSTKQSSDSSVVVDVLFEKTTNEFTLFVKPHIESTATHGTGCTLSSALAIHLASQMPLAISTHKSIQYVQHCISRGLTQLGKGSGPLNHLCHTTSRPVLAPAATGPEQVPLCSRLIAHSLPFWRAFTRHPFLQQLGTHTLPSESFIYFLKQDYLFLKNYARVWASGASSFTIGSTFSRIAMFAGIAAEMAAEADNHVKICTPWGITKDDLEHHTVESAATLAYTRFVLDVSRSGDALELLAATGPCLLGYGEAGLRSASSRKSDPLTKAIEGYDQWIDYYSGDEFQKVVQQGIENMEEYANSDPPSVSRMASLQRIWNA
jgi:hydroxymethylpyrimidine/phosphomethylpyrimidine kinase